MPIKEEFRHGLTSGELLFSGRVIGRNDGYRRLIIAVVYQAILDYRDANHQSSMAVKAHAKHWLLTEAPDWLETIGIPIDLGWWNNWIGHSCKKSLNIDLH